MPGSYLLTAKLDLENISNNYGQWPKFVSLPWLKVIAPNSRSQFTHTQNQCPDHNCLLPYWIGICTQLLSLTQGYPMTLTKGHNFEVKGTVHTVTQNVHPWYNFLLLCWIWIKYQTIVVHDLRGCHDLVLRSCLKGQEHSVQKFSYYLGYNFSMVFFIRMIINTHVVCNRAGIKFQLLLSDWKLICHFCLLLYPACNEQYRAFPGY